MRDSLRSCCRIGLCLMAVLLMFAAPASAAVLNLNFGESSSVQEINNGETWNNLQGSSGTVLLLLELEYSGVWVSIVPSGGSFHEQWCPKALHPPAEGRGGAPACDRQGARLQASAANHN